MAETKILATLTHGPEHCAHLPAWLLRSHAQGRGRPPAGLATCFAAAGILCSLPCAVVPLAMSSLLPGWLPTSTSHTLHKLSPCFKTALRVQIKAKLYRLRKFKP